MPPSSSEVSIGSRQYAHLPVGDKGGVLQFEQVAAGAALMHTRTAAVKTTNTATAFMTPTYFHCSR